MSDASDSATTSLSSPGGARGLIRSTATVIRNTSPVDRIAAAGTVAGIAGSISAFAFEVNADYTASFTSVAVCEAGVGVLMVSKVIPPAPRANNPIGVQSQLLRRVAVGGGFATIGALNVLCAVGAVQPGTAMGAVAIGGAAAIAAGMITGL